MPKSLKNH